MPGIRRSGTNNIYFVDDQILILSLVISTRRSLHVHMIKLTVGIYDENQRDVLGRIPSTMPVETIMKMGHGSSINYMLICISQ